jgi:L-2-hydroxyglutarate oxidase LhgO
MKLNAERVDALVIGAGVIGLAVARALALAGREVMVLEREATIGTGTSSRNSEVIHAGIYYPTGSLKARLCVQGREALYAYCAERGVAHQRCGKLIVANTPSQLAALPAIMTKAALNGVHDLLLLDRAQACRLEPELECLGAVHSPSTGIVDSHALMLALQGDLEHLGGLVACHSACDLARKIRGLDARVVPKAWYAKGSYFTLAGRSPFSRLIYPAPEPEAHLAGLGVHLTLDLGGQAKFGPDVQWTSSPDDLQVDPQRAQAFYAEVRRYWPGLPDGSLQPGYAGIRPKISGPHEAAADFCIQGPLDHGVRGLVNLFGIESPGLTSSLALAEHVTSLV